MKNWFKLLLVLTVFFMSLTAHAEAISSLNQKVLDKFPKIESLFEITEEKACCTALERYFDGKIDITRLNTICGQTWDEENIYSQLSIKSAYFDCYTSYIDDRDDTQNNIIENFRQ